MNAPSLKQFFIAFILLTCTLVVLHFGGRQQFSRNDNRIPDSGTTTSSLIQHSETAHLKRLTGKSSSSVMTMKDRVVPSSSNASAQRNTTARFVGFADGVYDSRRLGNQIFDFAALLYVAELTGRIAVLKNGSRFPIDGIFQLKLDRVNHSNICPCHVIKEKLSLAFGDQLEAQVFESPGVHSKTILVDGYRQSWKYTLAVEKRIRQHLVFTEKLKTFSDSFLRNNIPVGWRRAGFIRVGIHVRRGDFLRLDNVKKGYTVANETYFFKAMTYFTDRYSHVQFIVASDDFNWTREHLSNLGNFSENAVNITFSFKHNPAQDLAILSACDHVIMSTGTFGWWAAWLAKGTTIYYKDWPRKGSRLEHIFRREDFFPPSWIGMGD